MEDIFNNPNPWVVNIVGGVIGSVIAGALTSIARPPSGVEGCLAMLFGMAIWALAMTIVTWACFTVYGITSRTIFPSEIAAAVSGLLWLVAAVGLPGVLVFGWGQD